jgi:hypothetical protein
MLLPGGLLEKSKPAQPMTLWAAPRARGGQQRGMAALMGENGTGGRARAHPTLFNIHPWMLIHSSTTLSPFLPQCRCTVIVFQEQEDEYWLEDVLCIISGPSWG